MQLRRLGNSDLEVSPIGLGTWAIGGVMAAEDGSASSWGEIDDDEAVRAMQWAVDAGITFFDTSNNYGCGHAESLVGRAIAGRRDQVVLATKFGYVCRPGTRIILGSDVGEASIRDMLSQSLLNLGTDYIDLYQLHVYDLPAAEAQDVQGVLEDLVDEGLIRTYGWSCNRADHIKDFVHGSNCVAIQHHYNLLDRTQQVFDLCRSAGVTSIARGPLGMGLLTGKYNHSTKMAEDDFRNDWDCQDGAEAAQLDVLARTRDVLTRNGHTLPQAALAWLLTVGESVVPIPGFKTLDQVKDNVGVIERGLLDDAQMADLAVLLGEGSVRIT